MLYCPAVRPYVLLPPPAGETDSGSFLSISPLDACKNEGDSGSTPFTFLVTRSGDLSTAIDVGYAYEGVYLAAVIDGLEATDSNDFVGGYPSGTISFLPGESSKVITVNVQGDTLVEMDGDFPSREVFYITLVGATSGAVITSACASGYILNDDFNVIDPDPYLAGEISIDGVNLGRTNLGYALRGGDDAPIQVISPGGSATASNPGDGWTAFAAAATNSGYAVYWRDSSHQLARWNLNANGLYESG